MSTPRITLSDPSLNALHRGFDGATVSESSKRPDPEDPETSRVMKVRVAVYDVASRTYAILYKGACDRHELPGGARKKKDGKIESPARAVRRELREELGIGGNQILSIQRLAIYQETRERLDGLRIETIAYLVMVNDPETDPPELSERERESEMEVRWLGPFVALAAIAGQEHDSYTAAYDQLVNAHTISLANTAIASGALKPGKAKKPHPKKKTVS